MKDIKTEFISIEYEPSQLMKQAEELYHSLQRHFLIAHQSSYWQKAILTISNFKLHTTSPMILPISTTVHRQSYL